MTTVNHRGTENTEDTESFWVCCLCALRVFVVNVRHRVEHVCPLIASIA